MSRHLMEPDPDVEAPGLGRVIAWTLWFVVIGLWVALALTGGGS